MTNFEGHEPRECGEHRTVGPHRAWCYDCSEWCYPRLGAACIRCEMPALRKVLTAARALVEVCEEHGWEGSSGGSEKWRAQATLRAAVHDLQP